MTPISLATNTPGPAISVGDHPEAIVITPDGKTVYVTNGAGPNGDVTPVNTLTHQAGPAIKVGNQPTIIAITP